MRPAAAHYRLGRVVLTALILSFPASVSPPLAGQSDPLSKTKRIASTQHEMVMLLIKKKDFDQAAKEACKIFDMNWPDGQEQLLLKELLFLSEQFCNNGQASISLHLIDKNAKCFRQTASRIKILQEKGFLYKSLKQYDKALEYFNKARELEKDSKD